MGCYQRGNRFYITCNPRKSEWPRLVLPTSQTDREQLERLESLVVDELYVGGRRDIAMALAQKLITLDQLEKEVGANIKDVHLITLERLGLSMHRLPRVEGGEVVTFGELVDRFVDEGISANGKRRLSPKTTARYRQSYVCFARFLGKGDAAQGRLEPAQAIWDATQLSQYGLSRQDPQASSQLGHAGRKQRSVLGSTVNRDQKALSALRAFAQRRFRKHFATLPAPEVISEAEGDETEHLLAQGEFKMILDRCDVLAQAPAPKQKIIAVRDWLMFKYILLVLYWTGARLSEVLRLKWRQFVLTDAEPYVILEGNAEQGDRAMRRLTIPIPLLEGIIAWRHLATSRGVSTNASANVFYGPLTNIGTIEKAWSDLRKKKMKDVPNLEGHCLHAFRHDAAVGWIRAGASIEEVRTSLGHKVRDVTYRYVKYQPGTMATAGARRAAMETTNCADPLLADALVSERVATNVLDKVMAAHPDLAARLVRELERQDVTTSPTIPHTVD